MTVRQSVRANERSGFRSILLVEDEPFVRDATSCILQSAGFEVLTAGDAQEALWTYERCNRSIDLAMTDMVLPGRSGIELAQDLRKRSPEIAILLTSGYSHAEYENEAPQSRTHFLAKPYSKRTLIDKIESILGAAPVGRAATQAC